MEAYINLKKRLTIIIFIIIVLIGNDTFAKRDTYEVHFIDVGQGDCTLIKVDRKNYLIDSGAAYYTNRVIKYLDLNNVNEIEGIILTHYHDDHYEGIYDIARSKKVHKVYLPAHENNMKYFIAHKLFRLGVQVDYIGKNWSIKYCGMNLKAVGPFCMDDNIENNNSIVLQGKIGKIDYLFAGDCEKKEEEDMIKSERLKKCDVLKVPHHGLNTSTIEKFLNTTKPKVAIITSDGINTPDKRVEKRLTNKGVMVWRSDKQGNIIIKDEVLFCDKSGNAIKLK